jgi:hypothetical protein
MAFFDELPGPEREAVPPRQPWDPPEAEFPGVVPGSTLLLGRSDQAAVAITGILAYSAGFEIFLTGRIRRAGEGAEQPPPPPARLRPPPGRNLHFGMQLPDGTKVLGQRGGHGPGHDAEPAGPILRAFMAGGGPHTELARWWAWPLPPAGPLEFVCEWPMFGIAETRATIDAQLILDAASRSIRLWPEDQG